MYDLLSHGFAKGTLLESRLRPVCHVTTGSFARVHSKADQNALVVSKGTSLPCRAPSAARIPSTMNSGGARRARSQGSLSSAYFFDYHALDPNEECG